MLVPAIIYKEDIKQEFLKRIYDLEMCYFMACANYSIQNILYIVNFDECDCGNVQYAIIDDNKKIIGYFSYYIDYYNYTIHNFGLYSFDKNNSILGIDIYKEFKKIIKEINPHRIMWDVVIGNPVEKHYDKLFNRMIKHEYSGTIYTYHDCFKDKKGIYHNNKSYELIKN